MMKGQLAPWRNPFSLLDSFRRDMDDIFNRFYSDWERSGTSWVPVSLGYYPQVESYIDGNTLHVKADLPGVDPKNVEITVEGTLLTLKGERKGQQETSEGNYLRQEVQYGSFVRTLPLPEGVKAEDVQAVYHNGVLDVTIPLPPSMGNKKVPIQIEGEAPKQITA
jgi:HSP20 family protein